MGRAQLLRLQRNECCQVRQVPGHEDGSLGIRELVDSSALKFSGIAAGISDPAQRLTQKLVALTIYVLSAMCSTDSMTGPDQATLEEEHKALQKLTSGRYDAIPSDILR